MKKQDMVYDYSVIPTEEADPRNYKVSRFIPGEHEIEDVEFILDLPETEIIMKQYGDSCVGHAYAMAKKISEYQKTHKWIDVDPYWIYGTRYDGDYKGRGMVIDQGAKVLYKNGAVLERDFGVHAEMPELMDEVERFNMLRPDLVEAAKGLCIEGYAYIDPRNVEEMKTALKAGMPIVAAINAWNGMGSGTNGFIHCNTASGHDKGRHAVCIVGWVTLKDRPYWIVVNSCGIYQGYKGLVFWDSMRKIYEAVSISDTITPVKKKCKKVSFCIGDDSYLADGEIRKFDSVPYIKNERTYLPVRFVAEALGASVEWNSETGVATLRSEEAIITITHKSKTLTINGEEFEMDVVPEIVNNRMMAPVRYIAEMLNCQVEWKPIRNMVTITAL